MKSSKSLGAYRICESNFHNNSFTCPIQSVQWGIIEFGERNQVILKAKNNLKLKLNIDR